VGDGGGGIQILSMYVGGGLVGGAALVVCMWG